MIHIKCNKHPRYTAKKKPNDCVTCWQIFNMLEDEWLKYYIKDGRIVIK